MASAAATTRKIRVLIDLDGTLLDERGIINHYIVSALFEINQSAQAQGIAIEFDLFTARDMHTTWTYANYDIDRAKKNGARENLAENILTIEKVRASLRESGINIERVISIYDMVKIEFLTSNGIPVPTDLAAKEELSLGDYYRYYLREFEEKIQKYFQGKEELASIEENIGQKWAKCAEDSGAEHPKKTNILHKVIDVYRDTGYEFFVWFEDNKEVIKDAQKDVGLRSYWHRNLFVVDCANVKTSSTIDKRVACAVENFKDCLAEGIEVDAIMKLFEGFITRDAEAKAVALRASGACPVRATMEGSGSAANGGAAAASASSTLC